MTMALRIKLKEDVLMPGVTAGLLSSAALALCGKLHGKRASAPVSAVSHWVWPQEARRTAHPAPRHFIVGVLIHQTMSIGWAAFNALTLSSLRRALAGRDGAAETGAVAGIAQLSAGVRADEAGDDPRGNPDSLAKRRGREQAHRAAVAVTTTVVAAFGDYVVVPKRFTPGFEYHLPARHIAAVYVAFGAGLMVPFLLERWMSSRAHARNKGEA
jgi:hypothetical protein